MKAEKLASWTRTTKKLLTVLEEFEEKLNDIKSRGKPKNVEEIEERINRTAVSYCMIGHG